MSKLDDVAKLAGVSRVTVARVVNGGASVREATRQTVLEAIRELNYRPNLLAKGLATNRSHSIGLVMANVENPVFAEFITGATLCARQHNYDIIMSVANDSASMLASINMSINKMVDALLVLPPDFHANTDLTREKHRLRADDAAVFYAELCRLAGDIWGRNIPLEVYGVDVEAAGISRVMPDYCSGAYLATEHILKLGHFRVGYLGHILRESLWLERFQGYCQAMEVYGIPRNPAWELVSADSVVGAHQAVSTFLQRGKTLPTALVCANDEMGVGAVQAIQAAGLRVPEDISVVGHDGSFFSTWLVPQLTTVSIQAAEAGRLSVEHLIRRIDGQTVEETTVLPPILLPGGTTATYVEEEQRTPVLLF